jgi:hypothetical protein
VFHSSLVRDLGEVRAHGTPARRWADLERNMASLGKRLKPIRQRAPPQADCRKSIKTTADRSSVNYLHV